MRNRIKNVGHLSAVCVIATTLNVLAGCAGPGGVEWKMVSAQVSLLLNPGPEMQASVQCGKADSFSPVNNDKATVTVNGESVARMRFGYQSTGLTPVLPGENVTLHVVFEDADLLSTLVMPGKPASLTRSGTDSTLPITIGWAPICPQPDSIILALLGFETGTQNAYSVELPGTATSYTIPAGTLPSHTWIDVSVEALAISMDQDSPVIRFYYIVDNRGDLIITTD